MLVINIMTSFSSCYIVISSHVFLCCFFFLSKLSNLLQIIMYEVLSRLKFKLYIYLFIYCQLHFISGLNLWSII